jgi:SpoVK/Ycf46/Vps4 family AAA+-type ATPase
MSERGSRVFLAATANDVSRLPPELLRKGRFDEIFFVDLPDAPTREEIFRIHLRRRKLAPEAFDVPALGARSEGFSGAEIEQAVVAAAYEAHAAKRPLDTALVAEELARTRPLSVVMAERVAELRAWAAGRTVPAS